MTHELKTWPEHFKEVYTGAKTFEVRKNDRDFQVGDRLDLFEYFPETKNFSGQWCTRIVTNILHGGQFGIEKGYCVMSLK